MDLLIYKNKIDELLLQCAKEKWNEEADGYNQWSELGKDEKDGLIEEMKKIMLRGKG